MEHSPTIHKKFNPNGSWEVAGGGCAVIPVGAGGFVSKPGAVLLGPSSLWGWKGSVLCRTLLNLPCDLAGCDPDLLPGVVTIPPCGTRVGELL